MLRTERAINVISVYFTPNVTAGYMIIEFTTSLSDTVVNRFKIVFIDGVVTETVVIDGFIPEEYQFTVYPTK